MSRKLDPFSWKGAGQALRNPGLGPTDWEQISKSLGHDVNIDSSFTLAEARDRGLLQHLHAYKSSSVEV